MDILTRLDILSRWDFDSLDIFGFTCVDFIIRWTFWLDRHLVAMGIFTRLSRHLSDILITSHLNTFGGNCTKLRKDEHTSLIIEVRKGGVATDSFVELEIK